MLSCFVFFIGGCQSFLGGSHCDMASFKPKSNRRLGEKPVLKVWEGESSTKGQFDLRIAVRPKESIGHFAGEGGVEAYHKAPI